MIPEDTATEPDEQNAEPDPAPPRCVTIRPWNLTIGMYCRAGRGGIMFTRR